MAKIHGIPGEWARVKGTVLGLWPAFMSVAILGFALSLAFFVSLAVGVFLFVAGLAVLGYSLLKGLQRIERYFIGARGEEHVSGLLRKIPDSYHVYNDFKAGGYRVDHVVVGPAGVFAIETKCWRGKVTVEENHILLDGQLPDRSPTQQASREAQCVKKELAKLGYDGPVTPVLTFASDTFATPIAEVDGVVVMNASEIDKRFNTQQVILQPAELERLIGLLENLK